LVATKVQGLRVLEGVSQMNESYVPYQKNGSWYYDDCFGKAHGPFIAEQTCQERADYVRENDEAKGLL